MPEHHFYDVRYHAVHDGGIHTSIIVVRIIERAQDPFHPNDSFVCQDVKDGHTHIHQYVLVRRLDEWGPESTVQVWAAELNVVTTLDGEMLMCRGL